MHLHNSTPLEMFQLCVTYGLMLFAVIVRRQAHTTGLEGQYEIRFFLCFRYMFHQCHWSSKLQLPHLVWKHIM